MSGLVFIRYLDSCGLLTVMFTYLLGCVLVAPLVYGFLGKKWEMGTIRAKRIAFLFCVIPIVSGQ